jgi:hypothetical protein
VVSARSLLEDSGAGGRGKPDGDCLGGLVCAWTRRAKRQRAAEEPGLEMTFYDAKCVQVIDPFGNRIRFNEDLKKAKTP